MLVETKARVGVFAIALGAYLPNGLAIGKSAISKHPFLYNIALPREKTACRRRTARGVCKGFSIKKNPFHSGPQWQKTDKIRLCLEIVFFL